MHEASVIADLIRQVTVLACQCQAAKVTGVHVKLGALSHMSPEHMRGHFVQAARGTVAEEAQLTIETLTDILDPLAQELLLHSIEVED